ncbi:hypothetical protein A5699_02385 [Mycobacterium sp. E802]|nr:hypothetical protein A5699_02385 [Mycobacterium sp. E802]
MVGIHVPQVAGTLSDYAQLVRRLEAAGYDRVWVGEVNDVDAVTTATLAATATTHVKLGVFVNVYTRAPSVLAMTANALAHLAPGRVQIVLGTGSALFVEGWNGIPHERQHAKLQDTLQFLRSALSGQRVNHAFPTIAGHGFSLASAPAAAPSLLVAAAGPRALELAAGHADGVALNWITPGDLQRIHPLPAKPGSVTLIVPICPTADRAQMEQTMRPVVATYLAVPGYAQQQRSLGRGAQLENLWQASANRDIAAARGAIPDEILDEFVVWGSPEHCRRVLTDIETTTGASVVAIVFPPPGTTFEECVLT